MKNLSAFVVLVLAVFTSVAAIAQTSDLTGARPPSITVAGTGESHGKPDFAQVQVGVVTEALTAAEALRKNNEAMSQLIVMIRKRGIEDRDLQTVQFNVSPRYKYDKTQQEPPKIAGYQVTNEVHVKVRNLLALGAFLDERFPWGPTRSGGSASVWPILRSSWTRRARRPSPMRSAAPGSMRRRRV